jgi:hypothetical protein
MRKADFFSSCGQERLQKTLLDSGSEVVFHVLGFSANHNAPFLESLSFLGTSDGSYSFVSPGVRHLFPTFYQD